MTIEEQDDRWARLGADEPEPERDRLAVAALVAAVVALVPLAVALALVALRRIARSDRGGEGLAWGALALSGAWLAVGAVVLTSVLTADPRPVRALTTAPPATVHAPETSGEGYLFGEENGTCFDVNPYIPLARVTRLPCTSPHDAEIYAMVALPRAGGYPGAAWVQEAAEASCAQWFDGKLDPGLDYPGLEKTVVVPDQQSYYLDSTGACVFYSPKGKLTRPAREMGVPRG
ncbi:DUF4190 domain-containing protein [Amycolatopsis acidiphila]|uniref:Septum formation-related domain-containing protein n=1 Tax=Amycolatopsis acidiphila TaxID=715473 RepID=A0A558A1Z6_9PSEU|nr:DUF4190 domain-containing protein [Amycolatopsis acidiphila]TVT18276.1 hypothetical protein FNH06_28255 [Amycolatopsis acidiphila]UIJ57960.1 DUF4190 domain-containing protein [Amycolatopsis acidiphila]GHG70886.1 hypothetical protein GCM10017788_32390 [Amycolatopsis acidiphila]